MNKKITQIVSIALCIMMFLIAFVPSNSINTSANDGDSKNLQSAYTASKFKEKYITVRVRTASQDDIADYPDNFGGIYIDQNNDLHINYTHDKDSLIDNVTEEDAQFDKVKYSYNYLNDICNCLSENMLKLSIDATAVDEVNNKVMVSIEKSLFDDVVSFLNENIPNFDKNCLLYQESQSITTTDKNGTGIKCNGGILTLGYNARKSSTKMDGFVTAGHLTNNSSNPVYRADNNYKLGTIKNRQYSGKIDAAFVQYDNQGRVTYVSESGNGIIGTYSSSQITTGMLVGKYGNTTKRQNGKVTHTSINVNVDSPFYNQRKDTFTDQIQIKITQKKGDSGAPVFFDTAGPIPPSMLRPGMLLGIATFGKETTWDTAWVSKATNINSAFGIKTYIMT